MPIRSIPPVTSTGGDSRRRSSKRLRSADPVRFRGRREPNSGGNRGGNDFGAWKPPVFKKPPPKKKTNSLKIKLCESELSLEIFDEGGFVKVIGDIPGVEKEDIVCWIDEGVLKIHVSGDRGYKGEIELPVSVKKKFDLSYVNGVVEIRLRANKEKRKKE